jgi:hypothetical protein
MVYTQSDEVTPRHDLGSFSWESSALYPLLSALSGWMPIVQIPGIPTVSRDSLTCKAL